MSSSRKHILGLALAAAATLASAQTSVITGLGRPATAKEIAAWDIDVRPDFKGLPPGRGTVAKGQQVWEAQCAGCHGVFGESNEVFSPIVGGTTKDDVKTGRVAKLRDVRGSRSIYHNNSIQTWLVQESGEVKNVQLS